MDDLYDEFGNYIGEVDSDEEDVVNAAPTGDQYLDADYDEAEGGATTEDLMQVDEGPSNAVILHEDKQYYPSASQIYGPDVETLVQEEDTQALDQPIITPIKEKKFTVEEAGLPPVFFSRDFMTDLMNYPNDVRNIAFAGHLHSGKTAFVDMLVMQTHDISAREESKRGRHREEQLRYTDPSFLERERGLSIKSTPMSLVLQATRGKSHLFNMMDTPGHVNFLDETAAAMRLADGIVLIADVVEGVQISTEQIIKHAVLEEIPIILVINKMDRLILELKIPPSDAYFKLKHVVEEVNTVIENTIPGRGEKYRVSPEKGNVAFACTSMDWIFTLPSFAQMYADSYGGLEPQAFAQRLWGDIFFNPQSRKFTRKAQTKDSKRAFVNFILEPIYKLYSHTISESPEDLAELLGKLGIQLKPMQYKQNAKELLKMVCSQFFGSAASFVDMVANHIPSPVDGAQRSLEKYYTGPLDTDVAKSMQECDANGLLVVQVTKLYSSPDASSFFSLGRVMSGTASPGQQVRVLGEGYTLDDEEDMVESTISATYLAEARYNVPVSGVPAGNWVLLSGVDNSIMKTATIVPHAKSMSDDPYVFRPITHFFQPIFKVAVEPINPSELPKMLDGLRKVTKSYPLITTKVEESGEHIVLGTGELYLDCVLHDLRRVFAEMDIKISDPVTRFAETCAETSAIKCYATTPNSKSRLTMVAEPLDDGIADDIEAGRVSIRDPVRSVARFFEQRHGYDTLAARNLWAFGPDDAGPNVLQNDTLPGEVDAKMLRSVRDGIKQGFSWATREGPLCEEPIRNTKFRLTDVALAQEAIARGQGQIIPTARRACYSSFLLASPRLMEPLYSTSMLGPQEAVAALYTVLARRRGHILSESPVPGTPLYRVDGLIPVIDSFGFETDLRIHTQGKATVSCVFDRWSVVPGDPLDRRVSVKKLEAATGVELARDFVSKTRRRKGLKEEVGVARYLEGEVVERLKGSGILEG